MVWTPTEGTKNKISYEVINAWMQNFDVKYGVTEELNKFLQLRLIGFNLPDDKERYLTIESFMNNMKVVLKLQAYLHELGSNITRMYSDPLDYTKYELKIPKDADIAFNKGLESKEYDGFRDDIAIFLRSFDNPISRYVKFMRKKTVEVREELVQRGYVKYIPIDSELKDKECICDPMDIMSLEEYYRTLFL